MVAPWPRVSNRLLIDRSPPLILPHGQCAHGSVAMSGEQVAIVGQYQQLIRQLADVVELLG